MTMHSGMVLGIGTKEIAIKPPFSFTCIEYSNAFLNMDQQIQLHNGNYSRIVHGTHNYEFVMYSTNNFYLMVEAGEANTLSWVILSWYLILHHIKGILNNCQNNSTVIVTLKQHSVPYCKCVYCVVGIMNRNSCWKLGIVTVLLQCIKCTEVVSHKHHLKLI